MRICRRRPSADRVADGDPRSAAGRCGTIGRETECWEWMLALGSTLRTRRFNRIVRCHHFTVRHQPV